MKGFITRSISGIIYVLVIAGALLFKDEKLFAVIFSLLTAGGIYELIKNVNSESKNISSVLDMIAGVLIFLFIPLSVVGIGYTGLLPILTLFIARFIQQLYIKDADPVKSLSSSCLALFYVALPMAAVGIIYTIYSPIAVLAMFIFLWLNDTGAFCVGCTIGRHRLFERISPKKSWEGFFGGLAACIITGILAATYLPEPYNLGLNMPGWILFGATVSIIGTWGDLVESMLKRSLHIKDSGKIMPGHGGILDRIDSLLLAAPATLILLYELL